MDRYTLFSRMFWSVFFILYVVAFVLLIYLSGKYLIIPALELINTNMYAKTLFVFVIIAIVLRIISKDDKDKYII